MRNANDFIQADEPIGKRGRIMRELRRQIGARVAAKPLVRERATGLVETNQKRA